jgi:hypothetical protein
MVASGCSLWPWCGHLETMQAVRLKSGSSMSLFQLINFCGCEENCIQSSVCSVWPGRRMQACCTGLPSRMPIKVNPGEHALQSAASDGQRHTPREHNLNYTIWTLYAESVSVPQTWGAPCSINQVIWGTPQKLGRAPKVGARPKQSVKSFGVRPTFPTPTVPRT